MKKFLLSFFVIIAFAFYALYASTRASTQAVATLGNPTPTPTTGKPTIEDDDDDGDITIPKPTPSTPATNPGSLSQAYKDGTYTGKVADAYFGSLQVAAVIKDSKLSDVTILQYPNDRGTSIRINNQALPILRSEAIASQSAKVDIVSGATQTSQGFQESLANALELAAR